MPESHSTQQQDGGRPVAADLQRLVVDYHAVLYRYALRLSGSSADAEDLVQQAFLVAQQKLEQVRAAECVKAWLFTVLRRLWLRDCQRRRPTPAVDLGESFDLDDFSLAEKDQAIDEEALRSALAELPDEFRIVLVMFYFEECSYQQIAEALDLPAGTVMSRLSRAKGHLRRRLSQPAAAPPQSSGNGNGNGKHAGEGGAAPDRAAAAGIAGTSENQ